jgi:osomolarity two-component system, sensor histidine kinase SLN1
LFSTDYSGGSCGHRDFAAIFFYGTAPPAVALVALGQSRAAALLGFAMWIGFACGAVVAQRVSYIRNRTFIVVPFREAVTDPSFRSTVINLLIFYAFLLIVSYQRDTMDRRLYTMRSELKVQYRAKQRAEISERKAME